MTIQSRAITLRQISEQGLFFRIPVFQRLYVWSDEQVHTLLEDLWTAYEEHRPIAYLGGILVMPRHQDGSTVEYDLIDGQQRFTTLWLLALTLGQNLSPFLAGEHEGALRPRLGFPIRPDIDDAFRASCTSGQAPSVDHEKIDAALGIIQRFTHKHESAGLIAFSEYVLNNLTVVMTQFPATMDLNKVFEVINNRGLQLQHHEILKARLLQHIDNGADRERYAALWEACAYMDDYVERNLRRITRLDVHPLFTNAAAKHDIEELALSSCVLQALRERFAVTRSKPPLSLAEILSGKETPSPVHAGEHIEVFQGSRKVRSIISFSMLLQHALRIWLHEQGEADIPRISDKDLLSLFDKHFLKQFCTGPNVRKFIALVWEVRYCFDKHVIKWVEVDGEEHHLIHNLHKRQSPAASGKTYTTLFREEGSDHEFALLQSMLYHSQQITTHYWLTPLLAYMRENRTGRASYLRQLKHLDNHLLCTSDNRPLIERSHALLSDGAASLPLLDLESVLSAASGLKFAHYWFYKLEFVLWSTNAAQLSTQQLAQFRMTAKSSIEHISPQTAQEVDLDTVSDEVLDAFGNLALVSRGINSEYGNKPFNEKRQHFHNRNRDRVDSLKMKLIYNHKKWGDTQAKRHQKEMIDALSRYLATQNTHV